MPRVMLAVVSMLAVLALVACDETGMDDADADLSPTVDDCTTMLEHEGSTCSGCTSVDACQMTCAAGGSVVRTDDQVACTNFQTMVPEGESALDVCGPGVGAISDGVMRWCTEGPALFFSAGPDYQTWSVNGQRDGMEVQWQGGALLKRCLWDDGQLVETLYGECP